MYEKNITFGKLPSYEERKRKNILSKMDFYLDKLNLGDWLKEYYSRYRGTKEEALIWRDRIIKLRELKQNKKPKIKQKDEIIDKFRKRCHQWVEEQIRLRNINLNECNYCGLQNNLIVHHKRYSYPFELNDVIILCDSCHRLEHQKLGWGTK